MIIGEYGLLGFDRHTGTIEQGEKLKFFEYFGYYARQRQITTMLWDNGQHFGRTSAAVERPGAVRADQVELDDPVRHGVGRPGVQRPRVGAITAQDA